MGNHSDLTYIYFLSSIRNLGNVRVRKILSLCPKKENFFRLSKKDFKKIQGIDEKIASEIVIARDGYDKSAGQFTQLRELAEKKKINIITIFDDEYPENLKNIYDPPVLLYTKGRLVPEDKYSISVIGTRYPTEYGKAVCKKLTEGLSELKLPIISGFARGIDSFAHYAAMKSGNHTYAVFGCGADIIYPAENKALYDEIIEKGGIISEFEIGSYPDKSNFPMRNRIISGISLGTLVIESGLKGGSLLTARLALDQDREVFAVPGGINSRGSDGTNDLIKKGYAKLVSKVDDIIAELEAKLTGYINNTAPIQTEIDMKSLKVHEQKIYSVFENDPITIDRINELTGLPVSDCLVNLLSLEFKGLVRQMPGKHFVKI